MKPLKPEYFEKKYFLLILFTFFFTVTFALFYSSLNNYFLADDFWYLLKISKRSWVFSLTQFYSHFDPFPVFLNKTIFSVWNFSPVPYRLLLYIGHAISCVLVYMVCVKLFGFWDKDVNKTHIYVNSLLCAAIFFIMHVHTENIIYINGHHEMLFSVFFMAAFYFYLSFKQNQDNKDRILLNIFFIFALLSKENAVFFLPLIILTDFFFFRVKFLSVIKNYYSLAVIVFVYAVARIILYNNERLGLSYSFRISDIISESIKNILFTFTAFVFSLNFIQVKEIYRSCQSNLICTLTNLIGQNPLIVLAILITMAIYLLFIFKRNKAINFGFLFIFVTIFPFMWLAGYERYLYLPSFGFVLIVGQYFGNLYFQNKPVNKYFASILLSCFILYNIYSIEVKKENYKTASGLALEGINIIIKVCADLPLNSEVYFRNLPDNYNGAWIFRDGVQYFPELYLDRKDLKFNKIYEEDIHTDINKNVFVFNFANGKLNLEN